LSYKSDSLGGCLQLIYCFWGGNAKKIVYEATPNETGDIRVVSVHLSCESVVKKLWSIVFSL
jgi:hypothetical protein